MLDFCNYRSRNTKVWETTILTSKATLKEVNEDISQYALLANYVTNWILLKSIGSPQSVCLLVAQGLDDWHMYPKDVYKDRFFKWLEQNTEL